MGPAQYVSKDKVVELKKELESRKTEKRKAIADALEFAKSLGDLSENAEYHQAREEQAANEDRINQIEAILRDAVLVKEQHGGSTIRIGSTADIRRKDTGEIKSCFIVGSQEADLKEGKVSNESPLGAAMLGKSKGDMFTVNAPSGQREYEVIMID